MNETQNSGSGEAIRSMPDYSSLRRDPLFPVHGNPNVIRDSILFLGTRLKYLSRLRLAKLLFLAELASIDRFGKPLTAARFESHQFGPYTNDLEPVLEQMRKDGLADIKQVKTNRGHDMGEVTVNKTAPIRSLDSKAVALLEFVVKQYGLMKNDDLVRASKEHPAFRETLRGEPIDLAGYLFDKQHPEAEDPLRAQVREALGELKQGKGKSFKRRDDLLKHLRAL